MEKILLVDDDHFFRQVYGDLLQNDGYAVDTVSTSHEALERIKESYFDQYALVVVDLVLPDMGGLDLLSRIKRHDATIEVIIVTGKADVETAIAALKNGAKDYLVKPIHHDEFRHAVALCLEQRRLLEENKELKGLVKLLETGQSIATCLDLDRLHTLLVELLMKEVGVTRALGMFLDQSGEFSVSEISGFANDDGNAISTVLREHIEQAMSGAQTVVRLENFFPTAISLKRTSAKELSQAILLLIRSKNTVHGVVALFNDPGKEFPEEISRRKICFILEQGSLALENASRFEKAKNLLYVDDLTGLFNHRYLNVSLDREIKRADRYAEGIAVVFLDLDSFKGVNDCYGHLIGSAVLKEVGQVLVKAVREIDTVIRYGGDEFVIILVQSCSKESANVAERIRRAIDEQVFMQKEGYNIHITASLGFATYPEDGKTRQELLDKADQAMYRGKNSGRNVALRAETLKI